MLGNSEKFNIRQIANKKISGHYSNMNGLKHQREGHFSNYIMYLSSCPYREKKRNMCEEVIGITFLANGPFIARSSNIVPQWITSGHVLSASAPLSCEKYHGITGYLPASGALRDLYNPEFVYAYTPPEQSRRSICLVRVGRMFTLKSVWVIQYTSLVVSTLRLV